MYKRLPIVVALIFCIRATCLSRASNNGVHGSWQTRPWFNSTFEWNAKSGSSVAGPEVVALDSETYMAPGFLDSNALSPGLMMMNLFRFPGPIVIPGMIPLLLDTIMHIPYLYTFISCRNHGCFLINIYSNGYIMYTHSVCICQRRTEAGTNNRCLRILVFYYRRRKDNPINTHRYKFIIAIITATTRHITSTAYYTYPPGVALAM